MSNVSAGRYPGVGRLSQWRWRFVHQTTLGIVLVALLLVSAGVPAAAYVPPGTVQRVSATEDVTGKSAGATPGAISGDGSTVAYSATAALVASDTNGATDVYVRDLGTGALERVSVASGGGPADAASGRPSLSRDGRFVAFDSDASNLVPGDTNGVKDVFVHDRVTGTTVRASVTSGGGEASGASTNPSLSDDGQVVSFQSTAEDLVATDANDAPDVFVRDLAAGTTEIATVSTEGVQGSVNVNSQYSSLSGNGRFVVFVGRFPFAAGAGERNPFDDVYVRDRALGVTELASVASDGGPANGNCFYPSISSDGRYVAFGSFATNLVPHDMRGPAGAYVRDRLAGTTERITTPDGAELDNVLGVPRLSGDGRSVTGNVLATNFGPADDNDTTDVYVVDLVDRTVELVSATPAGVAGNAFSHSPDISDDGRRIAFFSAATDLVRDGVTGSHLYVRDRGPALGVADVSTAPGPDGVVVHGTARFPGTRLVDVRDPATDAVVRLPGAELVGTSVVLRPEAEDLLLRVDWATSSRVPGRAPLVGTGMQRPSVLVYGFPFALDGVAHEVRATGRMGVEGFRYELLRCEPACTTVAALRGGVGTIGDAAIVAVPLAALGVDGAAVLQGLSVYVAVVGDAGPGGPVDRITSTDVVVPTTEVALGAAPAGTPPAAVAFHPVDVAEGRFQGTVAVGSGAQEVWARACVGDRCEARATTVG